MLVRSLTLSLHTFHSRFHDNASCWAYLESVRWPNGPLCPQPECRSLNDAGRWKPRDYRMQCRRCGKQFHAATGTQLAGSHLAMEQWFTAIYLILGTNGEITSTELARQLSVTRKTAARVTACVRRLRDDHRDLVQRILEEGEPKRTSRRRRKLAERFEGP